MLQRTPVLHALKQQRSTRRLWGAPGAPRIKMTYANNTNQYKASDMIVTYTHNAGNSKRMLHYLGKHVPHAQKSLWSPDTPVSMDRHLFKLTTLDMDAFKYWFGVQRAFVTRDSWKLLWRAGLLPPTLYQHNPLMPRPIFEKTELYAYWLKNRKDTAVLAAEAKAHYMNSMVKAPQDAADDRPVAPWL
jgi:hypothetical protein